MAPQSATAQRSLVAAVQVLGLSVWFSATAIAPSLRAEWDLSSSVLNLADRVAPQRLIFAAATGAAGCTALLAATSDGLGSAVPLRFLTGFFLAGIYPVGLKLVASWSESVDRGRWFGVLIGR